MGHLQTKARADGFAVRTVEYDLGAVQGALLQADNYLGRAKAVVDADRRVLLGVTFVGQVVVDLLHAATIAVLAAVASESRVSAGGWPGRVRGSPARTAAHRG